MSLTPTTDLPLGFKAPDFSLPNAMNNKKVDFEEIKGTKGTLVMFICNHCPFVVHVREELVNLANDYLKKGIGVVAISSNDVDNYPQDSPEKMKELAEALSFPFPYLYDESQEVAKAYDAACTPDFSIFDADNKCVYRGQLDGSRPGNDIPVTGKEMREALDQLIESGTIDPENQKPSIGCNIKWKA